ncbi:MAG: rhomboid family intramembrane serine protease [Microscillaceae bacterium]|nr:rhomboid family intramembrane serine protease [Microscillaceae bacterium]
MSLTGLIILATTVASLYAEQNPELKMRWVFNPYYVKNRREYYRFLSSGFIHEGYMHLAFNMITLYYFGTLIETNFAILLGPAGYMLYLFFYLSALVVSEIPRYWRYLNNHHRLANSLGASGAISAVLLAGILFNPGMKVGLFFVPVMLPGFIFGALYLFYSAYMDRLGEGGGGIAHDAHLYGALYGILFAIAVYPSVVPNFLEYLASGNFF